MLAHCAFLLQRFALEERLLLLLLLLYNWAIIIFNYYVTT